MAFSRKGEFTDEEAREMALRYLARRDYSELELSRKMSQRGVAPDVASAIAADMVENGLVSDERYAEIFCRLRFERGYGPMRIQSELRNKGVSDAIIAGQLANYDDLWHDSALAWVEKRIRGELDQKQKARLYRSGMNRGFSHDHIMRALDRVRQSGRSA